MTEKASDDVSTYKVFKFSGKDDVLWREWKIKTLAYARRKNMTEAFLSDLSNT